MSLEEYKSRMPNLEEQQKQREALEDISSNGKEALSGQALQTKVFQSMADSLKEMSKLMGGTNGTYDDLILANLDGTKEKYEALQRIWFKSNGAEKATPEELTALVDRWYQMTRQLVEDFDGWVDFYNQSTSSLATGIRRGDLENMECVPSTDKEAGKDDFAGHPLFAVTTCNWEMNGTEPVITAIKGISPDFEQNNPNKYVGVLQMSGYHWWTERNESNIYEKEGYRATYSAAYNHIEPLPESVKMDGTVREWVLHGKYMAGTKADGSLTCCSSQMPMLSLSHNSLHTATKINGEGYSGGTTVDRSFIILMTKLLFASKTLDGILNGCFAYDVSIPAQVSENGTKRVLVAKGNGGNFLVGSTVIVSSFIDGYDYIDRGKALTNGAKPCKVLAIDEISVSGITYDAIYVDAENLFNTSALGEKVAGTTYITTMPWESGSNDNLQGNNGALNVTDAKHPISIQGIELCNGGYELLADVLIKLWKGDKGYYYTPYIIKEVTKQAENNITSDYLNTQINLAQPVTDGWQYIKHQAYKDGLYFTNETGGSNSTYERDAVWMSGQTGDATRQFMCFGNLSTGIWTSGLSCSYGGANPRSAHWHICARLSPNGNRGNWQA